MIGGSGLTPGLAVEYVRELSADVRAVVVLDARGEPLAGPPELAAPARALLAAGGDAAELEAGSEAGVVCAVRSPAHAAVAVCGRFAIGGVVREDLRAALGALEERDAAWAGRDESGAVGRAPEAAASESPEDAGDRARDAQPLADDAPPDPALLAAAEALISALQRASAA
jgi:hypothetical protein